MAVHEHQQLLQLEQATLADVEQYGECPLTDKTRVQKLSQAIQNKLSQIRALTRDLELLMEEVDRFISAGALHPPLHPFWLRARVPVLAPQLWLGAHPCLHFCRCYSIHLQ